MIELQKEQFVLNLRELATQLIASGRYQDSEETDKDIAVLDAIEQRDQDPSNRNKVVVDWLNLYKVLMSFTAQERIGTADQILAFADERSGNVLGLNVDSILPEFLKLEERIKKAAPLTKAGKPRDVTSLTSKALWCCYPNEVPIYDRNAVNALGVISRICRITPRAGESEYARFLDLWIQVYREVEPIIDGANLSGCPHKVRVLDRLLWWLGESGFYRGDSAGW